MAEVRWSQKGLQVRCAGVGFTVAGAGFAVWDERLPAALEAAALLRLPAGGERPAGHDDPARLHRAAVPNG